MQWRVLSVAIVLTIGALFEALISFVRRFLGNKPQTTVRCNMTSFQRKTLSKCKLLLNFTPPLWGSGALFQLYLAIACPTPNIDYYAERLTLADGGHVMLDWSEQPGVKENAPVLIVLHGIAGHSQERYIRRMVGEMMQHGWVVVVYNRRGHRPLAEGVTYRDAITAGISEAEIERFDRASQCLPETLSARLPSVAESLDNSPRIGASCELVELNGREASPVRVALVAENGTKRIWPLYSDVEDMAEVVAHVSRVQPAAGRIYAVGFSCGSNALTHYVGETAGACPLAGAVSVANGYDVEHGLQYIRKHAPMLERMITYNLAALYERIAPDLEADYPEAIERHRVKSCRTIRDIDSVITSAFYNVDVDEYYRSQSSVGCVPDTAIPMLLLNAGDDPLMDPEFSHMGHAFAKDNDNIVSVITSHGGHLGWVTGWRKQWMCPAIGEFLRAADETLQAQSTSRRGGPQKKESWKHRLRPRSPRADIKA